MNNSDLINDNTHLDNIDDKPLSKKELKKKDKETPEKTDKEKKEKIKVSLYRVVRIAAFYYIMKYVIYIDERKRALNVSFFVSNFINKIDHHRYRKRSSFNEMLHQALLILIEAECVVIFFN